MEFIIVQFYFISHFVQIWLLPPGLNLFLALVGFFFLWHFQRFGISLMVISFVSLWLLSTPMIAQYIIDKLQFKYPALQIEKFPTHTTDSAIIVLGGGETFERLRYAVYLYKNTHMPAIMLGGELNELSSSHADLMLQELRENFKPPAHWRESPYNTTKDEGDFLVPILQKNGIHIAYLVTNAWHIPRAMYTFNSAFRDTNIKIIAAPMGYVTYQNDQKFLNYFPSIVGLKTSTVAIHEYIGILFYFLRNLFV